MLPDSITHSLHKWINAADWLPLGFIEKILVAVHIFISLIGCDHCHISSSPPALTSTLDMQFLLWNLFLLCAARHGGAIDPDSLLPLANQAQLAPSSEHLTSDPSTNLAETHPINNLIQEASPRSNNEGLHVSPSNSNKDTGRVRTPVILCIL